LARRAWRVFTGVLPPGGLQRERLPQARFVAAQHLLAARARWAAGGGPRDRRADNRLDRQWNPRSCVIPESMEWNARLGAAERSMVLTEPEPISASARTNSSAPRRTHRVYSVASVSPR